MQRRTMLGWFEYLDTPGREYTESEFMALMLFHIRQHIGTTNGRMLAAMQALEHVEGMMGAIDEMCARNDPNYAASSTVRAALDASRDELRELAAAARRNGDGQAER